MRHCRLRWAAIGLAAVPGVASANAGIGFFLPAAVSLIVAFIPVFIVEGAILSWQLRLKAGRGQWVSLIANLLSTVAGLGFGIAFDLAIGGLTGSSGGAGQVGFLVSLFFMFWISWWIETWSVKKRVPEAAPGAVRGATFIANLVSYFLLGVAILFSPIEMEPGLERSRMTEAINMMGVSRTELAEEFQANGKWPAPKFVETRLKTLRRLWIEADGRVVGEIASKRPDMDGKTIVYEPRVENGKLVGWLCYVPEAPLKNFPAACRFRSRDEAAAWR